MSELKTAIKALAIAAGIVAVAGALVITLNKTGAIDRAANNINAAKPSAAVPGPDTIPEGTWIVGTDAQPGTYQPTRPVAAGAGCYWAIYRSGSNKRDIIANELLDAGGRPTVVLEVGHDFSSHDCGTWEKVK